MNADPNLGVVEFAVAELGDLTNELVLVGGCAVGLLITDVARPSVRHTIDVDLITEVAPTSNYYVLCEKLRAFGFSEQSADGVICRWMKGDLLIDVMPTDDTVLGFTNSWYGPAAQNAVERSLPSGRSIRMITSPYFLATKLEAFASRGNGDYLHHDMEDIVTVVDGREEVVEEVRCSDVNLRDFLMEEFEALLGASTFTDRLTWLLHPQDLDARRIVVLDRMRLIAGL